VKEIIRCSGTQFDEQIVKAFCESLSRRELETSTQVNALK
jgi:HD-GYP domain-containing protein (c-di-GMP phosphodiesterase class II)